jgi:hypothetical protein
LKLSVNWQQRTLLNFFYLDKRIVTVSGEGLATEILIQQLGLAVHKGSVAFVLGSVESFLL